ncbi:MAG: SH3 domain-containing protein, partial [Asgard group archaeon]|nr:SH3 domain-containing protein [Asgard group archaeon]
MEVPFQVKSLFPYESTYEDDLTFGSGVVITVTSIENDEWYSGEYNGKSGMFPKNFVEIIQTPIVPTLNRPTKHQPKEEVKQEPIVEKESEPQP